MRGGGREGGRGQGTKGRDGRKIKYQYIHGHGKYIQDSPTSYCIPCSICITCTMSLYIHV